MPTRSHLCAASRKSILADAPGHFRRRLQPEGGLRDLWARLPGVPGHLHSDAPRPTRAPVD